MRYGRAVRAGASRWRGRRSSLKRFRRTFLVSTTKTVMPREGGASSTPRPIVSITTVSGILDRPPSRTMTTEYDCAFPRRVSPGSCDNVSPKIERAQGMPGAGWHPRSRVQNALRNAHTSIQVQPKQPGIPRAMVLRLISCSPWRRIRLASIAGELTARIARSGFANLRRLDASNGRQNHTVLPYAASPAKNSNQPSAGQPKPWRKRLSAVRLRAMFAHG
jgi:hypothetical protein